MFSNYDCPTFGPINYLSIMKRKRAKQLPASAYRLGMAVRIEGDQGEVELGKVTAIYENSLQVMPCPLDYSVTFPFAFNTIKPYLRKLSTLTEKEARKVYELDRGEKFNPKPYSWTINPVRAKEEVEYEEYYDGMQYSVISHATGSAKVLDYLDSILMDTRGYIEQGLAIDLSAK